MPVISFENLSKIHIFPEFHGCGSKTEPAMSIWSLKLKWACLAQFLGHNLLALQNCIFFEDKQMILVSFFEIHNGIWDKNIGHECHIHLLSHPCPIIHLLRKENFSISGPLLYRWNYLQNGRNGEERQIGAKK